MSELFFNESSKNGGSGIDISDDFDILKYIDETDPFNSFMLYLLSSITTQNYTITKYQNRVDLIANEIFGNPLYYSILIFLNPYSSFTIKEVIKIITKEQLIEVFQNIQRENEKALEFNDAV